MRSRTALASPALTRRAARIDRAFVKALRSAGFRGPIDSDLYADLARSFGFDPEEASEPLEDYIRVIDGKGKAVTFFRLLVRANTVLLDYEASPPPEDAEGFFPFPFYDIRDRIFDSLSAYARSVAEGFPIPKA